MKLILFFVLLYLKSIEISPKRTMKRYRTITTTLPVRTTTHSRHIIAKSCLLEPDEGPCRGNITMHYFDVEENTCSTFLWGGCQGNGNRFETFDTCYKSCLSQTGWRHDKPGRPRYCGLSFEFGWCIGAEVRYYYDRLYKSCKKTIYSGCGGNKNNFYNIEQCDQVCRFGNKPLISERPDNDTHERVVLVDPPGYENFDSRHQHDFKWNKTKNDTDEDKEKKINIIFSRKRGHHRHHKAKRSRHSRRFRH